MLEKVASFAWLLGVVVFPNILFGALALYFDLGRPYVNFDYIFCAVLFLLRCVFCFIHWLSCLFLWM